MNADHLVVYNRSRTILWYYVKQAVSALLMCLENGGDGFLGSGFITKNDGCSESDSRKKYLGASVVTGCHATYDLECKVLCPCLQGLRGTNLHHAYSRRIERLIVS